MNRGVMVVIIGFIICGCTSKFSPQTRIQSVMDHPSGKKFTKILLLVPINDLIIRKDLEQAIIHEFLLPPPKYKKTVSTFGPAKTTRIAYGWFDGGTRCQVDTILYSATELVPLWDELTIRELDSALTPYGFDASLIVVSSDYWKTSAYIPRISKYEINIVKSNIGNNTMVNGTISESLVGGYYIDESHWKFETRMYTFEDVKLIWKATSISSGIDSNGNLEEGYAKLLVNKLQEDNIIPARIEMVTEE